MRLVDIPFSQAWAYCWTQQPYIVWAIIGIVGAVAAAIVGRLLYNKTQNAVWGIIGVAVPIIILAFALLAEPASVAANTTPEQAARGFFIR